MKIRCHHLRNLALIIFTFSTPFASTAGVLEKTTNGVSSRFTINDQGHPIPYLLDATVLPPGIDTNMAMQAVSNSFAAWSAVTPLTFSNEGFQTFGGGADSVSFTNLDGRIRIQLGDPFSRVQPTEGGRGGRVVTIPSTFPDGGMGGKIGTNEFYISECGYVVMNHTISQFVTNLANYEEIMLHEIGHALSLGHSTTNPTEPDLLLSNSIMNANAHYDGRGATLNVDDMETIALAYPSNTPPYGFDRVMDIVTAPTQPTVPNINEILVEGFDRFNESVSTVMTNPTSTSGTFTFSSNGVLDFTASGFFFGPRITPSNSGFYDRTFIRIDDGQNLSPPIHVRVISFNPDSQPVGNSDGIPDAWMTNHFGHADPQAGDLSRAEDDTDGDTFSNLDEYRLGSNPNSSTSGLGIAEFDGAAVSLIVKPYELYQLEVTTNFPNIPFSKYGNPIIPTGSVGTMTTFTGTNGYGITRAIKVP